MRKEKERSPGEVKGQHDVQRCPLEAVFRAHSEPRRLSVSIHWDDLQVSGVQSLWQINYTLTNESLIQRCQTWDIPADKHSPVLHTCTDTSGFRSKSNLLSLVCLKSELRDFIQKERSAAFLPSYKGQLKDFMNTVWNFYHHQNYIDGLISTVSGILTSKSISLNYKVKASCAAHLINNLIKGEHTCPAGF